MRYRVWTIAVTVAVGVCLTSSAFAQRRPTIAVMPTQYFAADAESAMKVTESLLQQFSGQGYQVVPMDRSRAEFERMGLSLTRDIGDPEILRFGRQIGADLVAHPQLLAVGIPLARDVSGTAAVPASAVLYLRVLNARTGKPLYTRQIGQEIREGAATTARDFVLTQQVADAAAATVTRRYFERVAGSIQEFRGMR